MQYYMQDKMIPCSDIWLSFIKDLCKGWRESIFSSFIKSVLLIFYEAYAVVNFTGWAPEGFTR